MEKIRYRLTSTHSMTLQARETAHLPFPLHCRLASERTTMKLSLPEVRNMNVDAVHTAFGVAFTFIWLLVGQILVNGR
ncbi:hypothetical protein Pla100_11480 [Neorhodopirellula pilleata]|uniref:Uncharacterized protein n=1 Tax=Neorhodopirellula pilleata TaxID=2714738 RepID=A0A5C6APQ2_9BACT|nr:hypothetical protein Pla100_11480 [Neorhodopirellula pilleata]